MRRPRPARRVIISGDMSADPIQPGAIASACCRRDRAPHADWIGLDGIGHCPQLDVPLETAELILGFTSR